MLPEKMIALITGLLYKQSRPERPLVTWPARYKNLAGYDKMAGHKRWDRGIGLVTEGRACSQYWNICGLHCCFVWSACKTTIQGIWLACWFLDLLASVCTHTLYKLRTHMYGCCTCSSINTRVQIFHIRKVCTVTSLIPKTRLYSYILDPNGNLGKDIRLLIWTVGWQF